MALIDKVKAEIERRMFEDYNGPDAEQNETAQGVCAGILAFLDALPEQSVEGLEEASDTSSEEFVYNSATPFPNSEYIAHRTGFKAGAKWQAEQGLSFYSRLQHSALTTLYGDVSGFEDGDDVIVQIRKK